MTSVSKRRLVPAILAAAFAVAVAAPAAHAAGPAQYCTNVFLYAGGSQYSGNTCVHGAAHQLTTVQARSTGTAAACAGGFTQPSVSYGNWESVYGGPTCGGGGGAWAVHNNQGNAAYPALHNHSTFQSRFEGLFYYQ